MSGSELVTREEVLKLLEGVVSEHVVQAVKVFVQNNSERAKEFTLIERVMRVEEELKSLKEVEPTRLEEINDGSEALQRETGKSFEGLSRDGQAVLGRWKRGFLLCNDLFWLDLAF